MVLHYHEDSFESFIIKYIFGFNNAWMIKWLKKFEFWFGNSEQFLVGHSNNFDRFVPSLCTNLPTLFDNAWAALLI